MDISRFAVFAIALTIVACSSQSQPAASAGAGSCKVDVKKICQEARTGPINLSGFNTDKPMVEQNGPATIEIGVPIEMEDGTVAAEGLCHINGRTRAVIYARLTKSPSSEREVSFLRTAGLCSE
jgi:hypothetical protein